MSIRTKKITKEILGSSNSKPQFTTKGEYQFKVPIRKPNKLNKNPVNQYLSKRSSVKVEQVSEFAMSPKVKNENQFEKFNKYVMQQTLNTIGKKF